MRFILSVFLLLAAFVLGAAQAYKPGPGETAIKLEVEGRGDIYIKLYTKEAPKATGQILKLAKQGFYNGQRFHRVERQPRPFLVFFGDPQSKSKDLDDPNMGNGGSGTKIPYEDSGYHHREGAVGLAHPVGNKDAGDSQFYMVLGPARFLDGSYTVFGMVVSGLDVMKRLDRGDRVVNVSVVTG